MNWDSIEEVFDRGRGKSPEARESLVGNLDPEEAAQVRSLWASGDQASSFLDTSAVTRMGTGPLGPGAESARQPGARVAARFTLVERLGAGGMGEVFGARDETLGRAVALKFVRPELAASGQARTRLEREARALCSLTHPNVCTVHDLVWDGPDPALVMERLGGETLAARLERGRLGIDELVSVACAVLSGLACIHSAGVVHRDLKPANVMLTPTGPKIFDFGIASVGLSDNAAPSTITREGRLVGSLSYMSPEQLKSQPIDARSDIFAFGCLLYEMAAGRRAFARATELATLAAILESEPQSLQQLVPDVSVGVTAVISRCLQKDPTKRFQDATQVEHALRAATAPRRDTAVEPTPKATFAWARVAVAVAIVALAGLVAYYTSRGSSSTPRLSRESVAVLPFSGPRDDTDIDYIADGLAESITNSLSRLTAVRVAPRSKAFAYKGKSVSVEDAGRALGVQTIVMGSVARAGEKIRVQAELVDVAAGTQLWGQQFEGDESDLLRMQTELTQMVSQRLTSAAGAAATARLQAGSTVDPRAYQAYLRGRHAQFTLGDVVKANAYFRDALAIDPNYALAYAGLAISYVDGLPTATMSRAKAAALRAIELDPSVAEGHLALATILGWYEFEWAAAEQSFKRAIELQPNDALTHLYYGWLLVHTGRGNEGIAQAQMAFGLDPLNAYVEMAYAQMHYACGQPRVAIERLRSLLSSSDFTSARWGLGYAHLMVGEWREAIRVFDSHRGTFPEQDPELNIYEAFAYKQLGDVARSRQFLDAGRVAAERLSPKPPSIAYRRAAMAAIADQPEEALEWLRRAVVERDPMMPFNLASIDPVLAPLRSDPRYLAITTSVTKAGLTPCAPPREATSAAAPARSSR